MLNHAGKRKASIAFLILASIIFFAWADAPCVLILIFSVIFNWVISRQLFKRKGLPAAGILVNLGILFYFKYYNFFIDNLNLIFSPPYSIAYWNVEITGKGELTRTLSALRILTDELLECGNVRLYGFDTLYDIICDLYNFMDDIHYSEDVGDFIMACVANGEYLLTKENEDAYFADLCDFYSHYDYASIYE